MSEQSNLAELVTAIGNVTRLEGELKQQQELVDSLRSKLSDRERELLGLNGSTPKPKASKRTSGGSTNVKMSVVQDAIRTAFDKKHGKLTMDKLVEKTSYDRTRLTNAIKKMTAEIKAVANDDKKDKSPANTAYEFTPAKN